MVIALLSAAALASAASAAHAGVVLFDDFSSQTPDQLNWAGDAVFTSNTTGNASVDLIGAGGSFDFYPGNGGYVDLDGTTGSGNTPAGRLDSVLTFSAGTYTLSFDLGGSQRGGINGDVGNTTNIILGSFSTSIFLNPTDPLALQSFTFSTTGGTLSFLDPGPSNNIGNILDNVTLSSSSSVPEPTTLSLLGGGLLALGFVAWRRRRAA